MQVKESQILEIRKRLLDKFSYFCELLLDPAFFDTKFHVELCDFMQYGKCNKLVVLPRTFLKTTVAAQMYALWRATRDPNVRVLVTSNTTPNAQKTVHSIKGIVENNQMYQLFFPDRIPEFNKTRWSDMCACLKRDEDFPEGTFEAAGVGSNIIRRHFNIIIEDDTVAPKKDELTGDEAMPTKEDIEKAVGFHKLTIPLLINEDDERIVIGTRWASYDLINHVKENEKDIFDMFDRQCWDRDKKPVYKRFSLNRLASIKTGMGHYMFNMLYLNTPLAKEDMTFNPDWFVYYEQDEVPEDGEVIITIDPADPPTGRKSQDYTAMVACKHTKKGIYVLGYKHGRLTDKKLISQGMDLAKRWGAYKIRIEVNKYAHLEAAFKEEMAKRNEYYSVDAVKAKMIAKEARIKQRLSPLFESRVIKFRKGMSELEQELTSFPFGRHDDLIDALSWQIHRYKARAYDHSTPKKKWDGVTKYTLGDIRKSIERAGRGRQKYPFSKQYERSGLS